MSFVAIFVIAIFFITSADSSYKPWLLLLYTMVVAVDEETVYLSGGFEVTKEELSTIEQWSYVNHVLGL